MFINKKSKNCLHLQFLSDRRRSKVDLPFWKHDNCDQLAITSIWIKMQAKEMVTDHVVLIIRLPFFALTCSPNTCPVLAATSWWINVRRVWRLYPSGKWLPHLFDAQYPILSSEWRFLAVQPVHRDVYFWTSHFLISNCVLLRPMFLPVVHSTSTIIDRISRRPNFVWWVCLFPSFHRNFDHLVFGVDPQKFCIRFFGCPFFLSKNGFSSWLHLFRPASISDDGDALVCDRS